jgi:hypothetical protein
MGGGEAAVMKRTGRQGIGPYDRHNRTSKIRAISILPQIFQCFCRSFLLETWSFN